MFLFLSIVTLLIGSSLGATGSSLNKFKGLKFADDANSYVEFTPDWSPFANFFSACVWIKDLGSAQYRPVYYGTSDNLIMTADGSYSTVLQSYQMLQSKISVSKGTWFHQCSTWSSSTRNHRVYVNGVEIGAKSTASGKSMTSSGALTLGNAGGGHTSWKFGGEMAYLNFYAKELSASDIASMAHQGMCLNIAAEDKNDYYRMIKWEELVELERSGTVTDLDLSTECSTYVTHLLEGFEQRLNKKLEDISSTLDSTLAELKECQADKIEKEQELEDLSTRFNSTVAELKESQADKVEKEQELKNVSNRLNSTLADLEEKEQELEDLSTSFNSTVAELKESQADKVEKDQELEDVSNRLNYTLADLEEKEQELEDLSTSFNSTVAELEETKADKVEMKEELDEISARLNSTVAELEQVTANRNSSLDWDIFLAKQFLDQNLTAEHAQLLRSTWDDIAEALVGFRITDEFIKLMSRVDRVEDRPWFILYSDNYFEAVFTKEMAKRLTSIWNEISEKLVGVTMSRGVIELLNYVTEKANCDTDTYS